ncbi:MAG: hypothetical protein ABII82_12830, partial [Verrucomicrobiota bacterium]
HRAPCLSSNVRQNQTMDTRDKVAEIIQASSGRWLTVQLTGDRAIRVLNAVQGRDMGAIYDHITTNIAPEPTEPHTIDFFITSEVLSIVDEANGANLYRNENGA